MRLPARFYRLALQCDADRLRAEVDQLSGDWTTHPGDFAGNAAVALVTPGGRPGDEFAVAEAMGATPALNRCPYVRQVLAALDMPVSRARLMRVAGGGTVPPHRDLTYHWYRRTRIHVPVTTHPSVQFIVEGHAVHMAAGEVWTFDNFRSHSVQNPAAHPRIHLVIDVKDGPVLRRWLGGAAVIADGACRHPEGTEKIGFGAEASPALRFEAESFEALTGDEVDALVADLIESPGMTGEQVSGLHAFANDWRDAFARWGHDEAAEMTYAGLTHRVERLLGDRPRSDAAMAAFMVLTTFGRALATAPRSGADPPRTALSPPPPGGVNHRRRYVKVMSLRPDPSSSGLSGVLRAFECPAWPRDVIAELVSRGRGRVEASRVVEALAAMRFIAPLAEFDRPLFIVSPPRSGSTLLFETLAQVNGVWTVGGERHDLVEGVAALHPARRTEASNRLTADDATPWLAGVLQARWTSQLVDRDERCYLQAETQAAPVRLLDKLPKHALRVPFLRAVFPDARFICLLRAPREAVSSIMDGWRSRRFVTYPALQGWEDRMPWSFLLPPGWRDLRDAPLAEIAAFQWRRTTEILSDDLRDVPARDWQLVRYEDLVSDPRGVVRRLCDFAGWQEDDRLRAHLGRPLPYSRHTLTPPHPDKWRRNERALRPQLAALDAAEQRLSSCASEPS